MELRNTTIAPAVRRPLRIGLNVLEKLNLYFATKENVLYFTAADAEKPASGSPPPTSGN